MSISFPLARRLIISGAFLLILAAEIPPGGCPDTVAELVKSFGELQKTRPKVLTTSATGRSPKTPLASADDLRVDLSNLTLRTTDGSVIDAPDAKFTVLCFLGTECPLAKLYAKRLQKLADQFKNDGVAFLGVNSNRQDSPAEIDAWVQTQQVRFSMLKDADQSIADAAQAKRTPEVVLLNHDGDVKYRGRIDDQYEPGIRRTAPTTHDLRNAISLLIQGKSVEQPVTESEGCLITRIPRNAPTTDASAVTFNRDVAPILNQHCVECHRAGEIAPMALTDYDEVVGWGQMILEVIDDKRMPPWHADPHLKNIAGARIFPQAARTIIHKWLDAGMPEGQPDDLPAVPKWAGGWHLPTEPDQTFAMQRAFSVPADGTVEYQYFVIDPEWKEDVWIQAAQVLPGETSVVHHCIVFVRPPDGGDFNGIGWLGAYVPGQRTIRLPPGHARRVPAGSRLVFQMHYTPNGNATTDQSKIGIWTMPASKVTHQVLTQVAIEHEFEIPPRTADHKVNLTWQGFPKDSKMLGLTPHMHLRGRSFIANLERVDGQRQELLSVPRYDFNWQHWYAFADPVSLDDARALHFEVTFDNSRRNPANPDATEYVSWGDQTWEEMAVVFFDVATPVDGSLDRVWHIPQKNTKKAVDDRDAEIVRRTDDFLKRLDSDGDGLVMREEVSEAFARYGFRQIDSNNDGQITREEIEKAARLR